MAVHSRDTRSPHGTSYDQPDNDARLSDLLRRFAQDAGTLVRQEVALAKLELRESVKDYARDIAKIGVAAAVALIGVLAFVAFTIIGLGKLLDNYWLSSLIIAVLLIGTAALLARKGIAELRRNRVTPEATVASMKANTRWVRHEARDLKKRLKAGKEET